MHLFDGQERVEQVFLHAAPSSEPSAQSFLPLQTIERRRQEELSEHGKRSWSKAQALSGDEEREESLISKGKSGPEDSSYHNETHRCYPRNHPFHRTGRQSHPNTFHCDTERLHTSSHRNHPHHSRPYTAPLHCSAPFWGCTSLHLYTSIHSSHKLLCCCDLQDKIKEDEEVVSKRMLIKGISEITWTIQLVVSIGTILVVITLLTLEDANRFIIALKDTSLHLPSLQAVTDLSLIAVIQTTTTNSVASLRLLDAIPIGAHHLIFSRAHGGLALPHIDQQHNDTAQERDDRVHREKASLATTDDLHFTTSAIDQPSATDQSLDASQSPR